MIFLGHRLQRFTAPGSMGVVVDATFINCFWPKLDRPTRIFAAGSSGIKVMGTSPRNVWFPDDVEFLPYYPDALYPAEQALKRAMPFRRGLINLTPQEAQIWLDAYNAAVATFPPTHSVFETKRDSNLLRHREVKSERTITLAEDSVSTNPDTSEQTIIPAGTQITKREYEEFYAELTPQECLDLVDGKVDEALLRASKTFYCLGDSSMALADWLLARETPPVEEL